MPAADVILFDGECGLCDRFVSFVLPRDRKRRFLFAPLQGAFAQGLLSAAGRATHDFDTMLVATTDGRLLERSEAVFHVLRGLGGLWTLMALLRFVPRGLTNWVYRQIARRRLAIFGKLATCRIPSPAERVRFVDTA